MARTGTIMPTDECQPKDRGWPRTGGANVDQEEHEDVGAEDREPRTQDGDENGREGEEQAAAQQAIANYCQDQFIYKVCKIRRGCMREKRKSRQRAEEPSLYTCAVFTPVLIPT